MIIILYYLICIPPVKSFTDIKPSTSSSENEAVEKEDETHDFSNNELWFSRNSDEDLMPLTEEIQKSCKVLRIEKSLTEGHVKKINEVFLNCTLKIYGSIDAVPEASSSYFSVVSGSFKEVIDSNQIFDFVFKTIKNCKDKYIEMLYNYENGVVNVDKEKTKKQLNDLTEKFMMPFIEIEEDNFEAMMDNIIKHIHHYQIGTNIEYVYILLVYMIKQSKEDIFSVIPEIPALLLCIFSCFTNFSSGTHLEITSKKGNIVIVLLYFAIYTHEHTIEKNFYFKRKITLLINKIGNFIVAEDEIFSKYTEVVFKVIENLSCYKYTRSLGMFKMYLFFCWICNTEYIETLYERITIEHTYSYDGLDGFVPIENLMIDFYKLSRFLIDV